MSTVAVRERPIIFSAPMVRAILDGTKTQTRRVVKLNPEYVERWRHEPATQWAKECPYGQPGDRLWVREAHAILHHGSYEPVEQPSAYYFGQHYYEIRYRADERAAVAESDPEIRGYRWRPSIHMPRWASRITLEITDVRVQKVQDISREDAIAEGIERVGGGACTTPWRNYRLKEGDPFAMNCASPIMSFCTLWDSINGKRAPWDAKPWAWAITFRRIEP